MMAMAVEQITGVLHEVSDDIGNLAAQVRGDADVQTEISEELDSTAVQICDIADALEGITAEETYSLFSGMTPPEFADRMRAASIYGADIACADAHRLMCGVLRELGYGEGVRVFECLIAGRG